MVALHLVPNFSHQAHWSLACDGPLCSGPQGGLGTGFKAQKEDQGHRMQHPQMERKGQQSHCVQDHGWHCTDPQWTLLPSPPPPPWEGSHAP